MKKSLSLILAALLCLSMTACGNTQKKAFKNSQDAFHLITSAYLATNEFSQDVYEAWRLGVNDPYDYNENYQFSDFADKMQIDQKYIEQGIASLLGDESYKYGTWESLPKLYNHSYFSAWVSVISEAYKCSGKADQIRSDLESAKNLMKELGDDYSDYEHYPTLKKYFTNTLAFYDFCCNPEGSFEQVVDTFNTYRNNARGYFFDLNYVFGDSIGGMDEYTTAPEETAPETTGSAT